MSEPRKVPGEPTNDPNDFSELPLETQQHVLQWIDQTFAKTKTIRRRFTSLSIRNMYNHAFADRDTYLTNDEMKGALIAAGFRFSKKELDRPNKTDYYYFNLQLRKEPKQ